MNKKDESNDAVPEDISFGVVFGTLKLAAEESDDPLGFLAAMADDEENPGILRVIADEAHKVLEANTFNWNIVLGL